MSEIQDRRIVEVVDPTNHTAIYRIDRSLFEKDGDIIQLPNPENIGPSTPDWIYIELRKNVQPYVSASLYKTICRLGYFAFAYIERWEHDGKSYYTTNVIITDYVFYLRRDEGEGGEGTVLATNSPYATIWFYDSGTCDGHDYFGNSFGAREDFNYYFLSEEGWINENKTPPSPFRLVEFSLLEAYEQRHR